jgi:hypothetical protein
MYTFSAVEKYAAGSHEQTEYGEESTYAKREPSKI